MLFAGTLLAAGIAVAPGAGTRVHVTASEPGVHIFVARGDVDANGAEDPFEDLGPAPLSVELAPGAYTVESGSTSTTTGHTVIRVGSTPFELRVNAGNATKRVIGTVVIALGVVTAVAGIVVFASVSPSDENFPRLPVSIPLVLGGAAIFGGGYALSRSAQTTIAPPRTDVAGAPRATILTLPAIHF